jgi:hypothetical protein
VLYYIIGGLLIVGMLILKDWLLYKSRGHAQPDQETGENYPVITGVKDALSYRQIDWAKSPKTSKKVK